MDTPLPHRKDLGMADDAYHYYLSTACLHYEHAYCQSNVVQELIPRWADDDSEILTRHKRPAECKFCAAPCICRCHLEERDDAKVAADLPGSPVSGARYERVQPERQGNGR